MTQSDPMSSPRILVVDDDPHIREVVRFALSKAGFAIEEAADGRRALQACHERSPDLVVLDILMPELDGTEVCRRLRAPGTPTERLPIVFLSSKDDEIDRILGLELGGDDYVTKPFSPRELVARVRAVLRRTSSTNPSTENEPLIVGQLRLDPDRCEATWNGHLVPLTVTELGLLRTLMERPGRVYTRDELMRRAYREPTVVADRTINSHVKRLRRKLAEAGGEPIETVHGLGYRLTVEDAG